MFSQLLYKTSVHLRTRFGQISKPDTKIKKMTWPFIPFFVPSTLLCIADFVNPVVVAAEVIIHFFTSSSQAIDIFANL